MTSVKAAVAGAGIGLAGGVLLGGLLWGMWFGGQGLPPQEVRERVMNYTAITSLFTLIANSALAVVIRSWLVSDASTSQAFHGALLGGITGIALGAAVGFAGVLIFSMLAPGNAGMWVLVALFMAIACGLIELVLGSLTGAYIGAQIRS